MRISLKRGTETTHYRLPDTLPTRHLSLVIKVRNVPLQFLPLSHTYRLGSVENRRWW